MFRFNINCKLVDLTTNVKLHADTKYHTLSISSKIHYRTRVTINSSELLKWQMTRPLNEKDNYARFCFPWRYQRISGKFNNIPSCHNFLSFHRFRKISQNSSGNPLTLSLFRMKLLVWRRWHAPLTSLQLKITSTLGTFSHVDGTETVSYARAIKVNAVDKAYLIKRAGLMDAYTRAPAAWESIIYITLQVNCKTSRNIIT